MRGRSHQSAVERAMSRSDGRIEIRALVLAGVTAWICSLAGAVQASEADTAAIAVTSAHGVTATSAMVAEFAALQSAYAAATVTRPAPVSALDDTRFDTIPRALSSVDRTLYGDEELGPERPAAQPIVMLERPKLGPLVVEQPMRVAENDVVVKVRAPGRRRSFATLEVTF